MRFKASLGVLLRRFHEDYEDLTIFIFGEEGNGI